MEKRKREGSVNHAVRTIREATGVHAEWEDTGSRLRTEWAPGKTLMLDYRICNGWNPLEGNCSGVELGIDVPKRGHYSPYIPNGILAIALRKAGWTCVPPKA